MAQDASVHRNIMSVIKPVIILPGTVLVFVPAILLCVSYFFLGQHNIIVDRWYYVAAAVMLFAAGLSLAITTGRLFMTVGRGTPAPWDPPKALVIKGPYRYVRNPMISGVLCMLAAESILFASWLIFSWLILFFIANAVYFPLFEEKKLESRFGNEYLEYKKRVPRWFPRMTAYRP